MGTETAPDPLEHFFSACPEMLFILGGDGTIKRVSAALRGFLGSAAVEGTALSAAIHPDDRRAFEIGLAALAEGDAKVRFSCRVRGADSAYTAFCVSAGQAPPGGEIHGALLPREPASDLAAAQREHEVKIFDTLLNNLSVVGWAIDRDGIFTFYRGKGSEAAGLKQGQLVGQNVFEVLTEEAGITAMRAALAGDIRHSTNETNGVAWEHWYVPLCDDKGAVYGVCGFTMDLTEVRRAERELRLQLELVERQQRVIRAMSTPIIEVWDKVLTLPMLGVVDSMRAAEVMENLLGQVSQKRARFAILDLTGVETVDTSTASHLLKLIHALRLLGAEGIITGIQPEVAQTMVALGMDLQNIVTLSNLRDGLRLCMRRMREGAT